MNTLRKKLIRLAFENPSMRPKLIPIIAAEEGRSFEAGFVDWVKDKLFKNPESGNKVKFDSLPNDEQKKIREKAKDKDDKSKGKKKEAPKKDEKGKGEKKKKEPKAPPKVKGLEDMDVKELEQKLKDQKDYISNLSQSYGGGGSDTQGVDRANEHSDHATSEIRKIKKVLDKKKKEAPKEAPKKEAPKNYREPTQEELDREHQLRAMYGNTLRKKLIRLAVENPSMRDQLIPIIVSNL